MSSLLNQQAKANKVAVIQTYLYAKSNRNVCQGFNAFSVSAIFT